jgi:Domain of unknown function (DU1801)
VAGHVGPGAKAKPGVREAKPRSHEQATGKAASRLIDQRIRDLGGWRGETLARMRALILQADPEVTEEWKWMGTPVWSHHGITQQKGAAPDGEGLPHPQTRIGPPASGMMMTMTCWPTAKLSAAARFNPRS